MEKILALLGDIKGFFTGASDKLDKVVAAEEQAKKLTADLDLAKTNLAVKDAQISELTAKLETAKTEAAAKDTEITTLKAAVETEKNRANAVIASQGLSPELTPAAGVGEAGATTESASAKYNRLLATSPREAGLFYAANADAIAKSRGK
jgi:Tfp pilus assembly protein FimV